MIRAFSNKPFPPLTTLHFSPTPNTCSSYPNLSPLEKCTNLKHLKIIHAHFITLGLARFTYITSRILAFATFHNNGDMRYTRQIFDQIQQPTIFNWNAMIKAFSKTPQPEEGLSCYTRMRAHGVGPNMHTFPFMVMSCARLLSLVQVHDQIFKLGFDNDVYVTSSLIKGYCKLGDAKLASKVFDESSNRNVVCWTSLISGFCSHGLVEEAREVFDRMPERNDVSWSAMITGYVQNERFDETIKLFHELRSCASAKLNRALLVSVLGACAKLGASEVGRRIHLYIDGKELEYGVELGTALVDFYAKCGLIEQAREVFGKMPRKDVMAWSAMIVGLALNGHSHSAIDTFAEMMECKIMPNAITFIGVLAACNHGGLVDEGWAYFKEMRKVYNVTPTIEHYGCMVDLLSRAGKTTEAEGLVKSMPMKPDAAIWGSLLNGCLLHGHVKLGERVGRHVIEMEPQHCGRYVGLANVYAAMGRWDDVVEVRRAMRDMGVATTPGWSLIEVDGVAHRFLADDKEHPLLGEIHKMLWNCYHHASGKLWWSHCRFAMETMLSNFSA